MTDEQAKSSQVSIYLWSVKISTQDPPTIFLVNSKQDKLYYTYLDIYLIDWPLVLHFSADIETLFLWPIDCMTREEVDQACWSYAS